VTNLNRASLETLRGSVEKRLENRILEEALVFNRSASLKDSLAKG